MTTSHTSDSKGMCSVNSYHSSLKCVFHNAGIDNKRDHLSPGGLTEKSPPNGLDCDLLKGER
jgi:hypothetical protein